MGMNNSSTVVELKSGETLSGPEGMILESQGYVNKHTVNLDGNPGSSSHYSFKVTLQNETKYFNTEVPFDKPVVHMWKGWKFTVLNYDPNVGYTKPGIPTKIHIEESYDE